MKQGGGAFLGMCPWDVEVWFQSDSYLRLGVAEQGAYLNLCFRSWQRQPSCTLPDDDEVLWKASGCRSPEEWAGIRDRVLGSGGWTRRPEGWTQPTVLDTYQESVERHDRAVRAGRIAGKQSARVRRELAKTKGHRTTVERPLNDRATTVDHDDRSTVVNPPSPSPSPSPETDPPLQSPPSGGSDPRPRPDHGNGGTRPLSQSAVNGAVYRLVAFGSERLGYRYERPDRKRLADRLRGGEAEAQIQAEYEALAVELEKADEDPE